MVISWRDAVPDEEWRRESSNKRMRWRDEVEQRQRAKDGDEKDSTSESGEHSTDDDVLRTAQAQKDDASHLVPGATSICDTRRGGLCDH